MGTTASTPQTRGPRVRASGRAAGKRDVATTSEREQEYDLLTAALLGLALGVGTAALLRRKPKGYRAAAGLAMDAARGSASSARRKGGKMVDRALDRTVERRMRRYLRNARAQIDDTVQAELRDLRRALRRQRMRLGL